MTTNTEWQTRKENAIARGQGNLAPIYIERALNAELWDVEGNRYIDFAAGIAVTNTGHSNPKVNQAVIDQVEKFSHTCVLVTPYDSAVRLAEKLNELAPGDSPKKTTFVTTGAEAVENCVKIARAHTGRRGLIAFNGAYHGRTNMTMALTGKVAPYKSKFGPFPAEIYHSAYPNEFHGVSVEEALKDLEMTFKVDIAPEDVAAIIIEPIQGEGGFYITPVEFMQALRKICDEHGIVLIVDEIQTGFGRTGKFFCSEYSGIEPDMITTAKGMAGGFPLAGVVGKAEIMDAALPGGLGGTYAGSPVGCAAALAVLEVIEEEGLVDRANVIGDLFINSLTQLQNKHPNRIGEIRNRGAMIAMELVKNENNEPDAELCKALVDMANKNGLLLISCGLYGNVIRFLPALTIPEEIVAEGLAILAECFEELV